MRGEHKKCWGFVLYSIRSVGDLFSLAWISSESYTGKGIEFFDLTKGTRYGV